MIKDKFKKSKKNTNTKQDEFKQNKLANDKLQPDKFENDDIEKSDIKATQSNSSEVIDNYNDIEIKYYKNIADIIISYIDTIDSFTDDYIYDLKEWIKFDANEKFSNQADYNFSDFDNEDTLSNKLNSELCEEIVNKDNYEKVLYDIVDNTGGFLDATIEKKIKKRFENVKQEINEKCKEVLDEFDKSDNYYGQEYKDLTNNNINNMKNSFIKLQNNLINSINKSTKTIIEVCDINFKSYIKILTYEKDVLKINRKFGGNI